MDAVGRRGGVASPAAPLEPPPCPDDVQLHRPSPRAEEPRQLPQLEQPPQPVHSASPAPALPTPQLRSLAGRVAGAAAAATLTRSGHSLLAPLRSGSQYGSHHTSSTALGALTPRLSVTSAEPAPLVDEAQVTITVEGRDEGGRLLSKLLPAFSRAAGNYSLDAQAAPVQQVPVV